MPTFFHQVAACFDHAHIALSLVGSAFAAFGAFVAGIDAGVILLRLTNRRGSFFERWAVVLARWTWALRMGDRNDVRLPRRTIRAH